MVGFGHERSFGYRLSKPTLSLTETRSGTTPSTMAPWLKRNPISSSISGSSWRPARKRPNRSLPAAIREFSGGVPPLAAVRWAAMTLASQNLSLRPASLLQDVLTWERRVRILGRTRLDFLSFRKRGIKGTFSADDPVQRTPHRAASAL